MAIHELTITNAPWQRLETYLSDTPVALELWYNDVADRWSMSLEIEGARAIEGVRLVPGADLLAPYGLGIGRLFLVDWDGTDAPPNRDALPAGRYRLWHDDDL